MSQQQTPDEIATTLEGHRAEYVRKAKLLDQIKQSKNDTNAAYREQMKEIKEQMDEEMGHIDSLSDLLKVSAAS